MASHSVCVDILGPGRRFVLWTQGCPFSCPGCIAPDFQLADGGTAVTVDQLVEYIERIGRLEGITISGGEPFMQAEPVAELSRRCQAIGLGVILFSGYRRAEIEQRSARDRAVAALLRSIDLLIDGRYLHELNDSVGMRGSSNQTLHFLSDRYRAWEHVFREGERRWTLERRDETEMLVGIPTLEEWRRVQIEGGSGWYQERLTGSS